MSHIDQDDPQTASEFGDLPPVPAGCYVALIVACGIVALAVVFLIGLRLGAR